MFAARPVRPVETTTAIWLFASVAGVLDTNAAGVKTFVVLPFVDPEPLVLLDPPPPPPHPAATAINAAMPNALSARANLLSIRNMVYSLSFGYRISAAVTPAGSADGR
jgi:hypothetical protein